MKILYISFLLLFFINTSLEASISIKEATCNGKNDPLNILPYDINFSWKIESKKLNVSQIAYRYVISSSEEMLKKGIYDIYDSGKINSNNSIFITYNGPKLKSVNEYYWKVKVWSNIDGSCWSDIQKFRTCPVEEKDWNYAKWIGYDSLSTNDCVVPYIHNTQKRNKKINKNISPIFRKSFNIDKKIQKAYIDISGLGHYDLIINGEKKDNIFLSPGWTFYDKTVLFNSYDITSTIKEGENVICIYVGNGFYNIPEDRYFKITGAFGNPKMICNLNIKYDDGTIKNISSDESWKALPSPITFNSIYGGEDYDARLEINEIHSSKFNDKHLPNAITVSKPKGTLKPEIDYPVILKDTFKVKHIKVNNDGSYTYDFGQNASAIPFLRVKGKKGQTIKLITTELLDKEGFANQKASGEPHYYTYTLKGEGIETWRPRFSYYGFRYIIVENAIPSQYNNNKESKPEIIELYSLHNQNSNPVSGDFYCSNSLFNNIFKLIDWGIRSNMQSVLTDCPHREKLSWLEQDYLMANGLQYRYNVYNLYKSLVNNFIDAQRENGLMPSIAPEYVEFEGGFVDAPEYGSALIIAPWIIYKRYGDINCIKYAYNSMKKYIDYLTNMSNNYILSHGLGDWFDIGPNQPGESQLTPKAVTATSIYYYDVTLLKRMALLLGNKNDANKYSQLANNIKQTFNNKFFNKETGVYSTGSQTAYAMPYSVGLVEEQYKNKVINNLCDSIIKNKYKLTSGDIGFHFLVDALDKSNNDTILYHMNNRCDVPGYGFQIKKGATALTESWAALENVSNNHMMLGHILQWFYSGILGISQCENSIAYKHIIIKPQILNDINAAKGYIETPYGKIELAWKRNKDKYILDVSIPVNSDAKVFLPIKKGDKVLINGTVLNKEYKKLMNGYNIGSGNYKFIIKNQ